MRDWYCIRPVLRSVSLLPAVEMPVCEKPHSWLTVGLSFIRLLAVCNCGVVASTQPMHVLTNRSVSIIYDRQHTHPFNGLVSGTTRVSRYQKGKPVSILLKQETVSGSGIRWAWSAPCSSQITMPAPIAQFLQAGCPSCRPTNSIKALKAGTTDSTCPLTAVLLCTDRL